MPIRIEDLIKSLDEEETKKKTYRCDTMSFISIFLGQNSAVETLKIKPSCYISEMLKTTDERHTYLTSPLMDSSLLNNNRLYSKIFQCTPEMILFQNCNIGRKKSVYLTVRNATQVLRPLKMHFKPSPQFSVTYTSKVLIKLAFGMSVKFTVDFMPDENRDYKFEIYFESDCEHFMIPVYGMGPRQLLDFPDEIVFPISPVKVLSTKIIVVRNIGDISAVANMSIEQPFDVDPKSLYLKTNESAYVTVIYQPFVKGTHCCELSILYETGEFRQLFVWSPGEKLYIRVCGDANDGDIRLENDQIEMKTTYMGLQQFEKIILHNATNFVLNFRWQAFHSSQEDEKQLKKIFELFEIYKRNEIPKSARLEYHDLFDTEAHRLIFERILTDEMNFTGSEDLSYHHPNFEIVPITGKIWPNSQFEATLLFSPVESVEYISAAYCEVTGLEERLELKICGRGKGPNICLNVDSVDFDYIFLCTPHSYEVVVKNDGEIPGHLTFIPTQMIFGGSITCEPNSLYLLPNEYKTFVITLSSNIVGQFVEQLMFVIEESNQKIKCLFKGKIVGPMLNFDKSVLDFGYIPLGFPIVQYINLRNRSKVSAEFSLKMVNDGYQPALTCWEHARYPRGSKLPTFPKEFAVEPSTGVVPPNSSLEVKVKLLPNISRKHSTFLQVRIYGVLFDELSLPVKFESRLSNISCEPSEITTKFAFINYEYVHTLSFENKSNEPAFFYVIPDEYEENNLSLTLSKQMVILMSNSMSTIDVTLVSKTRKKQTIDINLLRFGEASMTVISQITVIAQGPFVKPSTYTIDWGDIIVLEPTLKQLTLKNICPIPAVFSCVMDSEPSSWHVSPSEGTLMPGESVVLDLIAEFVDPGLKSGTMTINVIDGNQTEIALSAQGYGSSIVVEPVISPVFDMGEVFRKFLFEIPLSVSNKGTRFHQLLWVTSKEIKSLTRHIYEKMQGEYFQLEPCKLELDGGVSKEIMLKVRCDMIMKIEETYYCYGIIQQKGKRVLLSESLFKASFVDPRIEFPIPQLDFHCDIPPNCLRVKPQSQNLPMTSKLDVGIRLVIDHPFKILVDDGVQKSEISMRMEKEVQYSLDILLDPLYEDNMHSRVLKGHLHIYYEGLSHKDAFPIVGEINFPCVRLSKTKVDFGYIDMCTESYSEILMTNISPFVVDYCWYWCNDFIEICSPRSLSSETSCEVLSAPSTMLDGFDTRSESQQVEDDSEPIDEPIGLETKAIGSGSERILDEGMMDKEERVDKREELLDEDIGLNFFEEMKIKEQEKDSVCNIVLPLISSFVNHDHMTPALNLLPPMKHFTPVNNLIIISPNSGKILPHQETILSVSFRPDREISLKAKAVCTIIGGPNEIVKFTGECSRLKYKLSTKIINFGFKPFCEIWKEKFSLLNTGGLKFEYLIKINEEDMYDPCNWKPGGIAITPKSGWLKPNTSVEFKLKLYPGKTGTIDKYFFIEVGLGNPITFKLLGCAVFPQVYIDLKRAPTDGNLPLMIDYKTLSSLTSVWFDNEGNNQVKTSPSCSAVCMDEPSSIYRYKWEYEYILVGECNFPLHHHLCLGLERELANNYTEWFPTYLQVRSLINDSKDGPLYNFIAPGYILDFGYVISDTDAEASIALINCGYIDANVKLVLPLVNTALNAMGLIFKFPDKVKPLQVGETSYIYVAFKPLSETYPKRLQVVSLEFQLEVSSGPTIPISLTASVTYPYLTFEPCIDFGDVKCGNCKVITVPIKNEGYVACNWTAIIRDAPKPVKKNKGKCEKVMYTNDRPPPFTLDIYSGFYETETIGLIAISFLPISDGDFEGLLAFEIPYNKENQSISLRGKGIEPKVVVEDLEYDFGVQEPYPGLSERTLTVTNPCPFSVEVFFPDYDSQIEQEERVLSAITHLYDMKEILIPLKYYDVSMSTKLVSCYNDLAEVVAAHFLISQEFSDDLSISGSAIVLPKKRSVQNRQSRLSKKSTSASFLSVSAAPFLAQKSPSEIDSLIHDYINWRQKSSEDKIIDILGKSDSTIETKTIDTIDCDGTLIIFHGAPKTDYIYWANHTARCMNLPVVSLDQLIFEEASQRSSPSAIAVRSAINAYYAKFIMEISPDEHPQPDQLGSGSCISNPLEDLLGKVDALERYEISHGNLAQLDVKNEGETGSTNKTGSGGPKKMKVDSSPKKASRKKGGGDILQDTFLQISIDDITDLVKPRLDTLIKNPGVIVDSLTGVFVRKPWPTLLMLLKIVGSAKNIHFVALNHVSEHYKRVADFNGKVKELERKKICHDIDSMNADEYSKLPTAMKQLYCNELKRRDLVLDEFRAERIAKVLQEKKTKEDKEQKTAKESKSKKPKSGESLKAGKKSIKTAGSKPETSKSKGSKKAQSKGKGKEQTSKKIIEKEDKPEITEEEKMVVNLDAFQFELTDILTFLENFNRFQPNFDVPTPRGPPTKKSSKKESKKQSKKTSVSKSAPSQKFRHKDTLIQTQTGIPVWLVNKQNMDEVDLSMVNEIELNNLNLQKEMYDVTSLMKALPEIIGIKYSEPEPPPWDFITVPNPEVLFLVTQPTPRLKDNLTNAFVLGNSMSVISSDSLYFESNPLSLADKSDTSANKKKSTIRQDEISEPKEVLKKYYNKEDFMALGANFNARHLLYPGESVQWKLLYNPEPCRRSEQYFTIQVAGWSNSTYKVHCVGTSELPFIVQDPTVMFPKVQETIHNELITNSVFVLDQKTFHFNTILFCKLSKEEREKEKPCCFHFQNATDLTIEITISFKKDFNLSKLGGFTFEPTFMKLEPKCNGILKVWTFPTLPGNMEQALVYSIRNNPAPGTIKLHCTAVKGYMTIEPKSIHFNKILLFRKDSQSIRLINECQLPLSWCFTDLEKIDSKISTAKTKGTLGSFESDIIYFTYHAQVIEKCAREIHLLFDDPNRFWLCVIFSSGVDDCCEEAYNIRTTLKMMNCHNQFRASNFEQGMTDLVSHLCIQVYEQSWKGEPVQKSSIKFQIESYDVLIDIEFPDSKSTFLDFGVMKVDDKKVKTFELKNQGNQDMSFRIDLEDLPNTIIEPNKLFQIHPIEGELRKGSKIKTVEVTVVCSDEIELTECSVIKVRILSTCSCAVSEVVATIPISVSLKSSFARFAFHPSPDLNFGLLEVGKKKSINLTLENIGPFKFSYIIEPTNTDTTKKKKTTRAGSAPTGTAQSVKDCCCSTAGKMNRRSSRSVSTIKKSRNGGQKNFVSLGDAFSYEKPGKGVIEPSSSAIIKFESNPKSNKLYKETAQLIITDPLPSSRKATLIDLSVVGCLPSVNFDDINSVYREVLIVDDLKRVELNYDEEKGLPVVLFGKNNNTLEYRNVVVGSSHEARLIFTNTGQVSSQLNACIIVGTKEEEGVFSVVPVMVTIEPYTFEAFTVQFSPACLQDSSCTLELSLDMPQPFKKVKFIVELHGIGHMPFLEITKPMAGTLYEISTNFPVIDFGITMVGFPVEKMFAFKNTSPVQCRVVMEILGNEENFFEFNYEDNTRDLIKLLNPKGGLESSSAMVLPPYVEAEFLVRYPAVVPIETAICEVRLHTLYNPYERLSIQFKAESYQREIFCEGLEFVFAHDHLPITSKSKKTRRGSAASSASRRTRDSTSVASVDAVIYTLDFGSSPVGLGALREFTLVNRSSATIKFSWEKMAHLSVYPSDGHVGPSSEKVMYAFFFPQHPVYIEQVRLVCLINTIMYPVEQGSVYTEWDSHKEFTEWLARQNRKELRLDYMLSKVKEDLKEPKFSVISRDLQCSLVVMTSGLADFPTLKCPTEEITFPETLLCQSREIELTLENESKVPANFTWHIKMKLCQLPSDGVEGAATRLLSGACSMGQLDVGWMYPTWRHQDPDLSKDRLKASAGGLHPLSQSFGGRRPIAFSVCPHAPSDGKDLIPAPSTELAKNEGTEDCSFTTYNSPFFMYPERGIVKPESMLDCRLIFNPKQPFSFTADLICSFDNCDQPDIVVPISGHGLMSYCHIEVEESDYLKSKRRDISTLACLGLISGQLPLDTRVIELRTVGVKQSFRKKFNILNPTEETYNYEWVNVTESKMNQDLSVFSCPTPAGFIQGKRGVEVTFLFLPMTSGTFESLWILLIPKFSIRQPVLFVGATRSPSVLVEPLKLYLRPTLCGVTTVGYVSLINQEEISLKYTIEECSLSCEEKYHCLNVEPLTGVLGPSSETSIRLSYQPKKQGEIYFPVKCNVQKLEEPLVLKVFTKCFEVQSIITYELDGCGKKDLHSLNINYIDLGQLTLRIPMVVNFHVTNIGKAPFYYECKTDKEECQKVNITVECNKKREVVTSQLRSNIVLSITALEKTQFADISFIIKITKGPEYEVRLRGNALIPLFKFNFTEYDFGPCIVQTTNTCYNCVTLLFSNSDEIPLLVENTTPESENFSVDLTSTKVLPRLELEITLIFYPRDRKEYKETVQFLVNGLYTCSVDLRGKGIYLSVSLANPADHLIDMGPVAIGKVVRRNVEVVNNSLGTIRLQFVSTESVSVKPAEEGVVIGQKNSVKLLLEYSPHERGEAIFDKVYYKCQDILEPLLMVKGTGIGPDFALDKNILPFGATIVGCLNTLKVALLNKGDIGTRYCWDLSNTSKCFTIKPLEGYSAPGSDIVFEVSFYPDRIFKMIKSEVVCQLEDQILRLLLTGTSVDFSSPAEIIHFKCPVRSNDIKTVTIQNTTNELWTLHPILSGNYYEGNEFVKILPNASEKYQICYSPLTMTFESPHNGSLLLAYPDGTCTIYSLVGDAEPPTPVNTFHWEFPCKFNHTSSLELANWLQLPQRFSVEVELKMKPEKLKSHHIINYNKYVEVLPLSKCNYNIQFYFYKPCKTVFKVTFTNDNSKEYMFYLINAYVTECGSLGTLEMSTQVRKSTEKDVYITNPTDKEIVINFLSPVPDVKALNAPLIIESNSVGKLVLEYTPLLPVENKMVRVTCNSRELGSFPYDLNLSALPSLEEKPLMMSANFGARAIMMVPIQNLSFSQSQFRVKVDSSDIFVQDKLMVGPRETAEVAITYEPSSLNTQATKITFTSPEAGTYIFPVYATCSLPKPQGPYKLKPGMKIKINFKNVFKEKKTFTWLFDSRAFYSSKSSIVIESKKETKIEVLMVTREKLRDLKWEDMAVTGKLIVTTADLKWSNISWVYYLKGELL